MLNIVGIAFLVMILINFLLESILNFLNLRHLKQKASQLPSVFQNQIDPETYKKSMGYNFDSGRIDILEMAVSFLLIIYFVYFGGFEQIDSMARSSSPDGYYLPALIFGGTIFL